MANIAQSVVTYLKDAKTELTKVSWPSRKDTIRYSIIVVASCAAIAVFFGALDFGLSKALDKIIEVTAA